MINKNIFTLNLEERIINDVVTECIEMLHDKASHKNLQLIFEGADQGA